MDYGLLTTESGLYRFLGSILCLCIPFSITVLPIEHLAEYLRNPADLSTYYRYQRHCGLTEPCPWDTLVHVEWAHPSI